VGVALLAGLLLWAAGCTTEIQHDLDEAQANRIVVLLAQHGITARKERDHAQSRGAATWVIAVASADAVRAWQLLRDHELPSRPLKGFGEVFANPSLIPSATEERALLHEALSGEIARTLKVLDGVVDARVHLVLPEPPARLGEGPGVAPRASVLLKVSKLPGPRVDDVARLVAGSVARLEPSQVTVLVSAAAPGTGTAALPAPMASLGPLRVEPGSMPMLRGAMVAALGALAALAVGLLALAVKLGQARRRATDLERQQAELRASLSARTGGTASFVSRPPA
jgi:type III secretion protein J